MEGATNQEQDVVPKASSASSEAVFEGGSVNQQAIDWAGRPMGHLFRMDQELGTMAPITKTYRKILAENVD